MDLHSLSDRDLFSGLTACVASERKLVARIVAFLVEIEQRSLHLRKACSSVFELCTRRLGMSDGEAFRRITAARLVRRYPSILGFLERGDIHVSALVLLRDHLDDGNHEELLAAACGKSKREVAEMLAARAPKPDVPTMFTPLPTPPSSAGPAPAPVQAPSVSPTRGPAPLSPDRYHVQFTASGAVRDKLERATALLRHRNPAGEIGVVIEKALDALIEQLEKETRAKTERPQKGRESKQGHISAAARREVFGRDGEQCTFTDDDGNRCPSRAFLEIDHVQPRALGGSDEPSNLRIRCRGHNRHAAEEIFGKAYVEEQIHLRQRKSDASQSFDVATKALTTMGFREAEARRAIATVRATPLPPMGLEPVLRAALAVLC